MNLVLEHEQSGLRHYLDGRPVNCGTQLRLRVSGDRERESWVWARYEANLHPDRASVVLYTVFGRVIPDECTFLRWPREDER